MRPIWKNHWLLFRSTHSQKSPEKRDFVVHTQKVGSNYLLFFCLYCKHGIEVWMNIAIEYTLFCYMAEYSADKGVSLS